MHKWLELIPITERETYQSAGFSEPLMMGKRPLLLVIDVTYGFTGDRGQTLQEAVSKYKTACGPVAWETIPRIRALVDGFRDAKHPVVFTRSAPNDTPFVGRATKSNTLPSAISEYDNSIPPELTPLRDEWILGKTRASAFFQTPLASYLTRIDADSLVVCGASTSGCVRATVVDGFSNGYRTFVVEDCCFDRSYFSHCTNLFDMNAKYATVISSSDLQRRLGPRRIESSPAPLP